jgi:hypothetical protein
VMEIGTRIILPGVAGIEITLPVEAITLGE